jgi:2-polyprenyl-3-methyl-5-hydroxy-6-metoxy-1,4-benzoquinol methylase
MPTIQDHEEKMASYYADSYNQSWSLRHLFHKRRIDSLVKLVPTPTGVLDAGCGSGVVCRMLANKGCRVSGVDLLPARVAWSKQLTPEGEFRSEDLRSLHMQEQFDVVICSEVLEHFRPADRQLVLQNLIRHVKVGGVLIVTVPSALYIRLEPAWGLIRGWQYGTEGHDDEACHEIVSPAVLEHGLKAFGCESECRGTMCWGLIRWWIARKQ